MKYLKMKKENEVLQNKLKIILKEKGDLVNSLENTEKGFWCLQSFLQS